jgi:hypothetical protein
MMRLLLIARMRSRLRFVHGDALDYMRRHGRDADTCWFLDPPYPSLKEGRDRLYQTPAVAKPALFAAVSRLKGKWIMTNEDS